MENSSENSSAPGLVKKIMNAMHNLESKTLSKQARKSVSFLPCSSWKMLKI
jgi:hypothetical protein